MSKVKFFLLNFIFIFFCISCQEGGVKKIGENIYRISATSNFSVNDEAVIEEIEKKYYNINDFSAGAYLSLLDNQPNAVGAFWSSYKKCENKFNTSRIFYGVAPNDKDAQKLASVLDKYVGKGINKLENNLYNIPSANIVSGEDESFIEEIESRYYKNHNFSYLSFIDNNPDVAGKFWSYHSKCEDKFSYDRIFYGIAPDKEDAEKMKIIMEKYSKN